MGAVAHLSAHLNSPEEEVPSQYNIYTICLFQYLYGYLSVQLPCSAVFQEHQEYTLNIPQVRTACAAALGYLTFNRHAHRLLLVECRNTPSTYNLLTRHLSKDAKISSVFTDEFRRQKTIGLPSLR